MAKSQTGKQNQLTVNPGTIVGSQFADVVSMTSHLNETVIDFIFVHPRQKVEGVENISGETVSRVTLPNNVAKDFAEKLIETLKKHEAKLPVNKTA